MLEEGKISGLELMLLMVAFTMGSSVLLPPGTPAQHQAWQAVLGGMIEGGVFIGIFTTLLLRFPGKTAVEIVELVFGRMIGKLVAAGYLLYLFHLGSLVNRDALDFIKFSILERTPVEIILLVGLVSCAYLAGSGVEVLGRCSQGLVILSFIMFIFISVLLIPEIHVENYFPLFVIPLPELLKAIHGAATFPFGETVAFMMVSPFINKQNKMCKWTFAALLLSGLYLVLVSLRTVGVLGQAVTYFIYPAYHVVRLIDVAHVFTRMEILMAFIFLTMSFMKIAVLLYGSSLGIAQLFKLSDYRPFVFPLGVLMALLALFNFSNQVENFELTEKVYPIYASVFIAGIPVLTWIVALLRRLPKEAVECP